MFSKVTVFRLWRPIAMLVFEFISGLDTWEGSNKDNCLLILFSSIGLKYCFVEDKLEGINIFHWKSFIAWANFRYYLSRINLIFELNSVSHNIELEYEKEKHAELHFFKNDNLQWNRKCFSFVPDFRLVNKELKWNIFKVF